MAWQQPLYSLLLILIVIFTLIGLAWALFRFNLLDIVSVARSLVIEKLEEGIIIIDRKNRVVDINATAVTLLQKGKKNILGAPLTFPHEEWAAVKTILQEDRAAKFELAIDQAYYEVSVIVLASGRANGRLITLHNITQRRETELLLQQAKEVAEAADQAKNNFLTNMSHEIRTPLNAVVGMAEMLRQTQLNPNQTELIDVIAQSSDNLIKLINSILDFSQLEAHNLTLNPQTFDLIDCIESSIENVSQKADNKQLKLTYQIDEQTPTWLIGDPIRLRQILINLLENSIEFTDEGAVELTVTGSEKTNLLLQFTVKDSGIGIAADQIQHLFSPFRQVDSSVTRVHGGNGLGLAICQRLVALMGGDIQIQSTIDQGTAVHFTAQFSLASGETPPTFTLRQHKATLANKRLLVITKDANQRRQISKEARIAGLEVYAAGSLLEASYWIRNSESFDIALLDTAVWHQEPAILMQLRHKDTDLPLPTILLVPTDNSELIVAADDAKLFSGYLPSPVISSQMYDTFLNVLSSCNVPAVTQDQVKTMADRYPLKILIVEDNRLNQRILANMLDKLGYKTDIVGNGRLAVEAAAEQAYDVILMDIQMPVMDGVEATQQILAGSGSGKRPYIIAVTAHALEGDREYYLTAGMNEYISKPITLNQLVEVLYQAIYNRSEQDSSSAETAIVPNIKSEAILPDAPIDLVELAQLVGEDTDGFLKTMAPIFLEDTHLVMQSLATAVQCADGKGIQQAAHSLKGTSASMAMTKLAQFSHELEVMVKANDFSEAGQKLEQIEAEYDRIAVTLARIEESAV
jgi:signal transduction histidine kinase/CheY-like chemotaxis protein